MSDFEDDIFVDMKPVQTYTLTTISANELARLRRIEEAARDVSNLFPYKTNKCFRDLRAALDS